MPLSCIKAIYLSLTVLLIFNRSVRSLIIPEEIPTLLSVVYSNIPPIKKGTDSRVGIGFRLGEHADFQILVEYGPQRETGAIGNTSDTKRKRATIIAAALKGEMGPLAQAVAKYQTETKIKKFLEKYKVTPEILSKVNIESIHNKTDQKTEGSEWLSKWSHGLETNKDKLMTSPRKVLLTVNRMKVVNSQASSDNVKGEESKRDLIILKKLFGQGINDTKS